jgi:hypothetical protein
MEGGHRPGGVRPKGARQFIKFGYDFWCLTDRGWVVAFCMAAEWTWRSFPIGCVCGNVVFGMAGVLGVEQFFYLLHPLM